LVGESFEKSDLLFGEGPNLGTAKPDDSDGDTFPKQRSGEYGMDTFPLGGHFNLGKLRIN
jgi:hypothetical protein